MIVNSPDAAAVVATAETAGAAVSPQIDLGAFRLLTLVLPASFALSMMQSVNEL